jgi:hypothetical protein
MWTIEHEKVVELTTQIKGKQIEVESLRDDLETKNQKAITITTWKDSMGKTHSNYYDCNNKLITKVKFKYRVKLDLSSYEAATIKTALMNCSGSKEYGNNFFVNEFYKQKCHKVYMDILDAEYQQAEKLTK